MAPKKVVEKPENPKKKNFDVSKKSTDGQNGLGNKKTTGKKKTVVPAEPSSDDEYDSIELPLHSCRTDKGIILALDPKATAKDQKVQQAIVGPDMWRCHGH